MMGSGSRIQWGWMYGLVFGIDTASFPFAATFRFYIGPVWVQIGIGKGYDE